MRRPLRPAALLAALVAALLVFGLPAEAPRAQSAEDYIADISDLPVMPGLRELPDAGVAFDKPSGRIVSAFAYGAVTRAQVHAFYRDTLPQLGWDRLDIGRYSREGELLEIDTLGRDGDLTVRYTLQPH